MTDLHAATALRAARPPKRGWPQGVVLPAQALSLSFLLWAILAGPRPVPAAESLPAAEGSPAAAGAVPGSPAPGLLVGNRAPDFTAQDFRGPAIHLSDHRGKVVLLDFWAAWCGPCLREMPNLVRLKDKYPRERFTIVGVSLDMPRTFEKMKQLVAENKLDYPIAYDGQWWRNAVAQLYRINAIPATFVLDAEGVIVARDMRGAELERLLDGLLLGSREGKEAGGSAPKSAAGGGAS